MKILIEESVLRQALEALGEAMSYMEAPTQVQPYVQTSCAITALRTAIEQMEALEPVIDPNCTCDEHGACAYCWNGKKHDGYSDGMTAEDDKAFNRQLDVK